MEALLVPENPTQVAQYPDSPYDLTDEESEEWRAIVRSKVPGHFSRDNFPMLSQLCRHIVNARRIAQLVQDCVTAEHFNREKYCNLLRTQNAETMAIMRLSRSMRLTQQSRIDKLSTKLRPVTELNPWDRKK
jgi:hypothetical protein